MWGGLTLKKNSSESACNSSDAKALVFIDQAFGPSISAVITSNFPPLIPITGVIVQKQSDSTGFRRALQVIPRTDIHFWEWTPSLNQASTPRLHTHWYGRHDFSSTGVNTVSSWGAAQHGVGDWSGTAADRRLNGKASNWMRWAGHG